MLTLESQSTTESWVQEWEHEMVLLLPVVDVYDEGHVAFDNVSVTTKRNRNASQHSLLQAMV